MLLWYWFEVRKAGTLATDLAPTWAWLRAVNTGEDVRPLPVLSFLGPGVWRFEYDAVASGEAVGMIDTGAEIVDPCERFVGVQMTEESSRILGAQPGTISFTAG